jgi:hypothetical protein
MDVTKVEFCCEKKGVMPIKIKRWNGLAFQARHKLM